MCLRNQACLFTAPLRGEIKMRVKFVYLPVKFFTLLCTFAHRSSNVTFQIKKDEIKQRYVYLSCKISK